jgi:hypothetical protein
MLFFLPTVRFACTAVLSRSHRGIQDIMPGYGKISWKKSMRIECFYSIRKKVSKIIL